MVVIVLTACPEGLRGHLTRWCLEIAAGVFIGTISGRVREELWLRVVDMVKDGRALMVYQQNNEQGLQFRTHRHHWQPIDLDGLQLMLRPAATDQAPVSSMRSGWSSAARQRRARRK